MVIKPQSLNERIPVNTPVREPQTSRARDYEGMIPEKYQNAPLQKRLSAGMPFTDRQMNQMYHQEEVNPKMMRHPSSGYQQNKMSEDVSKPQMVDEKYQQYQQNQQRERMSHEMKQKQRGYIGSFSKRLDHLSQSIKKC
mmetsp:Transcript_36644/g.36252  ORF Transcript_36644/g.36252 Transcript_36644/m.36252 type:complete len:139 (+) Transcript_36644:1266-1682(+)